MFAHLRQFALFKAFSDADLTRFSADLQERHIAAKDVLFSQDDLGRECYVILAGELEVLTYVNGEELPLDTRQAGEIVGEMALLDGSPRSATVRAVVDTHLAVLAEAHFLTLMHKDPGVVLDMLRDGTTYLRNTSQKMITRLETKNAELSRAYEELQAAQAKLIRLTRLEEELAVARRIQRLFLPRTLPAPEGWQVAAFSRGAQAVGGDFFDCIELPDGHLGLVVADVCGKGVPAALFVALTRSLLRAASQAPWAFGDDSANDPVATLVGALWLTNDYITREHDDSNMFITLFYGVLNVETGHLSYVNSGHNPPLIVSANGATLRELDATSLPIGIMADQVFETAQTTIAAGEMLVGFSDGITEAMNPAHTMFGDERLHDVLRSQAGAAATTVLETVAQTVDTFATGVPQADDITLLVICRDADRQ